MTKNHGRPPLPTIAKAHLRPWQGRAASIGRRYQRAEWRGRLQARKQLKRGKPLPLIYEIRRRGSIAKAQCGGMEDSGCC